MMHDLCILSMCRMVLSTVSVLMLMAFYPPLSSLCKMSWKMSWKYVSIKQKTVFSGLFVCLF